MKIIIVINWLLLLFFVLLFLFSCNFRIHYIMLSNLLLTESESEATFIPNSAELIIVLELNVLSDASVLTSIPFDLEFMMSGNAKMCSNNYTLLIFANAKLSQQKLLMLPNYQFSYHSLYYRSNY